MRTVLRHRSGFLMQGVGLWVAAIVSIALFVLLIVPATPTVNARDAGPPSSPASDPGPRPTAFVPFAPNLLVNTVNLGYNYQVEPTMKIDSRGKIYVGWKEALTNSGGGQRVGFAYSTNGGGTISPYSLMALSGHPHPADPRPCVTADNRWFVLR